MPYRGIRTTGQQRSEYGEALIKQLAEDLEPRLAGLWMAQPYANAGVLPGVAGLEDFADTVYKICPSSGIGSKAPFTLVGLRASALGSESSVACGSTRPKALRSGWSIRQRAKFAR